MSQLGIYQFQNSGVPDDLVLVSFPTNNKITQQVLTFLYKHRQIFLYSSSIIRNFSSLNRKVLISLPPPLRDHQPIRVVVKSEAL
jgi:hypothetical protein